MKRALMAWLLIQGTVCVVQTTNACLAGWDALQISGTVFCWGVMAALVYSRVRTGRSNSI